MSKEIRLLVVLLLVLVLLIVIAGWKFLGRKNVPPLNATSTPEVLTAEAIGQMRQALYFASTSKPVDFDLEKFKAPGSGVGATPEQRYEQSLVNKLDSAAPASIPGIREREETLRYLDSQ